MASEQQVKVVIQGEDKTGAAFKSASQNVGILNKDVTGLAKVLGGGLLAAGAGLTAFLYSSAKGAAQAEVQISQVTTTLTAMGSAALKNKEAILQASQAAIKLGFDDEAAALSITRFYQATGDLTKAMDLNNLAMDLARAKNLDLATATQLVNQVLGGNGRALKQYQIDLKESATPLEALGELHEKVKGQAEAFAGTFQGQMAILNESVSNLKDTIGGAVLEALMPFIKELSAWASNPDVQKKVAAIATGFAELAKDWIPILVGAAKILYEGFHGIVDILSDVIVKIQQAIDKIIAFKNAVASSSVGKVVTGAVSELKFLTGARALGGPVMAGGNYLVGENGPEIFSPSASGFISPNGGGSAITINISGNTLLDSSAGEKIAKQIMDTLKINLRI